MGVLGGLSALYALYLGASAPLEKTEGIVQKIMYIHVPSAWAGYVCFFVTLVASIVFLANRKRGADRVALAAAEVGVFFFTLVLITGPLWARPVWNVWWSWDARLTSTLVMWFIFVGYLVTRSMAPSPTQGARYGAVLAILGNLLTPVVHMSVHWWRTLHPLPKSTVKDALSPEMRTALFGSGLAFLVLAVFFIVLRAEVEGARDQAILRKSERGS